MQYQVMIAEDSREIREIVSKYIDAVGYVPIPAKDGFEALELFARHPAHLILLDVMMPGIDGFEVLREIRKVSDVPVIMLTAKQEEVDRLKGFDCGADDYVVKPFSLKELMRRVKALIRRVYHETDEIVLRCADLSLHTHTMKLYKNDVEVPITSAEYALLSTMFRHQGQVLTREQLIDLSFGDAYEGYDRGIDSHIKRIRQKIEEDPKSPRILVTKYGSGYLFGGART
ncbi:MAG: response regulator transcription factor [Ethanoligenens sp.]|uniref:response regulator transcription factor n=1 Tax=Ethanoligenens sp. TaxID=2099655 RepID=UPI0039E881EE